ncbi:DNA/RNA non-specific endonuclease [Sphingomonas abietis]|uniref:DNA/RNA non-specific endonuclease n=1 Tax=Sphingomonas abietis TaxID=3012344 RepID=A0ABY7NP20_9SPHN|nr:DNA/RNA non-specific endonuclease [Sphingomonas abietis]WBO22216.1 DNA/RNA non-specific endonuclease [Sphingomonas abietis]
MRDPHSTTTHRRIPMEQFGRYLRTGLWTRSDEDIERKFNPWHDPATGQFTFKGGGGGSGGGGGASASWQSGGFTGGGGGGPSFGGGGASASWKLSASEKTAHSLQGKPPGVKAPSTAVQAAITANTPANHIVIRNGYSYTLDPSGRTMSVTGTLSLTSGLQRSRSAQAAAGGSDRLATDDGGHYVAARFNGPTDSFNHFAQDANFNRGGYRVLENKWAKDIKAGERVYVSITPSYRGSSRRPSGISVVYSVNGQRGSRLFTNSSKGKPHGA